MLLLPIHGSCIEDTWHNYRRKVLSLKDFRCSIASALTRAGKPQGKKRGRPSLEENTKKVKDSWVEVAPVADVRYDNMEHWPSHTEKKVHCKLCCTGYTRVKCQKLYLIMLFYCYSLIIMNLPFETTFNRRIFPMLPFGNTSYCYNKNESIKRL